MFARFLPVPRDRFSGRWCLVALGWPLGWGDSLLWTTPECCPSIYLSPLVRPESDKELLDEEGSGSDQDLG